MFILTAAPASPPPDNSVVAGPLGAAMFAFLVLMTVLICWSFTRQLKKAQKAKDAGLYGDEPVDKAADAETHDAEA